MNAPYRADPSHTFPSTLSSEPLDAVAVQQLERTQRLHEARIRSFSNLRSLVALSPCCDGPYIVLGRRMERRGHRAHFDAVEEIQRDDSTPASGSDPREEKHVRVEQRLASLPAVWRRRVDIEVPQQSNPQRLQRINSSE